MVEAAKKDALTVALPPVRSSRAEQVMAFAVAVCLTSLDLWQFNSEGMLSPERIFSTVIMGICLALVGWYPRSAGTVFFAALAVLTLASTEVPTFSFLALGLFAVGADWIGYGWTWRAFIGVGLNALAISVSDGVTGIQLPLLLVGVTVMVVAGLLVRRARNRDIDLQQQAQHLRLMHEVALATAHQDLVENLHRTTARELTTVVLRTEQLANSEDGEELKRGVEDIREAALRAASSLRSLTDNSAVSPLPETSVDAVIDNCRTLLGRAGIELLSQVDESAVSRLSPRTSDLLTRVVLESTDNARKYSEVPSTCHLIIDEEHDGSITYVMTSSPRAVDTVRPELSGRHGLTSLRAAVASTGGVMRAGQTGDKWLVSVRLPARADSLSLGNVQ